MKTGILTYHFGTNFGGQLQCYALNKTLEALGHEPIVVNYIPGQNENRLISDLKTSVKLLLKGGKDNAVLAVESFLHSRRMRKNFDRFRQNYLHVGQRCTLTDFTDKYKDLDALVVGSDQVWAPAHHRSGAYFFNFKPEFKARKIAYAPCCAINRVEAENKEQLSTLLGRFDSLSVRNLETQNFVKDLIGKEVEIVADPTILHDFSELKSDRTPKGKYVLVYILGDEINGGHKTMIDHIREAYGNLPVYVISLTSSKPKYFSWATKTYWELNPVDWVDFIRNATFVYTDSFHGVVFSLKFHVPFVAYYKERIRASRFIDLKTRFGLRNIVEAASEVNPDFLKQSQPDDRHIDEVFQTMKEKSLAYLKDSLL